MNNNTQPSDKEIADAVRVLARAGVGLAGNREVDNQMNVINSLFGGQNNRNNDMLSVLPYITQMNESGENGTKYSPELVKTMMMTNLMNDFSGAFFNSDNDTY